MIHDVINDKIEEIQNNNIGSDEVKIIVYENNENLRFWNEINF